MLFSETIFIFGQNSYNNCLHFRRMRTFVKPIAIAFACLFYPAADDIILLRFRQTGLSRGFQRGTKTAASSPKNSFTA